MNISKIKICKTNCIKKLLKNIKTFNFSNYSLALSYTLIPCNIGCLVVIIDFDRSEDSCSGGRFGYKK